MSTGIYDRARGASLAVAEDDDWFAHVQQEPAVEPDDLSWESELEWQLRDPTQPVVTQAAIVAAVVVAVLLLVAGVLIGRATKSATTRVVTVTAASQAQAPPASVAADDTSAAAGTPSTGTGTSAGSTTSGPSTSGTSTSGTSTSGTSTSGTSTSTVSAGVVPTDATLRTGATGAAVMALQKALIALRYAPGTADGSYGPTTVDAVKAFQTAKGLAADGVAGAKTLAAINAALAIG
jgi:murein L,D-transpeptidase YcbB/YkuD